MRGQKGSKEMELGTEKEELKGVNSHKSCRLQLFSTGKVTLHSGHNSLRGVHILSMKFKKLALKCEKFTFWVIFLTNLGNFSQFWATLGAKYGKKFYFLAKFSFFGTFFIEGFS